MVPSYEQVGDWLEEISGDFPDVFFEELDGGIQLAEEALPDPEFPPGEMYIMGEYCHDLLGRYIVLYYGSFAALLAEEDEEDTECNGYPPDCNLGYRYLYTVEWDLSLIHISKYY